MTTKSFHRGKYYVTFKRGFEDYKKDITVTVDKVFEADSLKISLSDEDDPSFLCILHITRLDYEDLKKQQGLLIDFDNFPSQLVRLFQQCAANNMFMIMQQTNPVQYYFEIIEHNEFKRLVHLSLRTGPATDADIKQHMAETILNLKKSLSSLKSSASSTDMMWSDKCANLEHKIHDLTLAVSKMEEDKLRRETEFQEALKQEKDRLNQERTQWQKSLDVTTKAQVTSFQENIHRKEKHIEELNAVSKQMKDNIAQLENLLSEKSQRLNVLENEVQKAHIEVATLKAKHSTVEREIIEKEKQYNQVNSRCTYLEQLTKDNAETIKELNRSLQIMKKEKASLEERLALSESLVNKNNEAAHSTSEQLLKANQIIAKQNSDLIELKEKLLCRTAIALEQEKVIETNTKDIEDYRSEINSLKENIEKINEELRRINEINDCNEQALKDRDETIKNNNMVIQWLHKKIEGNGEQAEIQIQQKSGIHSAHASTPYFLPARNLSNSSQAVSDESINFYATSKLSTMEDSPACQSQNTNNRVGLDPKYLKPATEKVNEDNTGRKADLENKKKGKENNAKILPKVDYREKKSGRSTYRATPVSAYFP
ncbi:spindle assembly abnormal protein 6 homolog [Amyelois transitella]|uniref:spindle assembly abnormal protein 6 homolog n=1 Tax=Amyelois transitella TaxID=680683 RepID=UPI00067DBB5B|nr:spindle assembly abnormal protein 6 homolog [Amyelois transitella]